MASLLCPLAFASEGGEPAEETVFADFSDWVQSYLAAGEAAKSDMLEEGRRLAEVRRKQLKALMEKSPKKALEAAISARELNRLPRSIRELSEQPFAGAGTVGVLAIDDFKSGRAGFQRILEFEGRSYRAFFAVSAADVPPNQPLRVEGYLLDRHALLTKVSPES